MSTYVGKFLLTEEQKSAAKMYLCRYIGIIYTVCHPTQFKTHVYVHMYNTLQESLSILSRGEVRQDCCCSKNVRYQIRGATCVADLEKQEITGNLENQKQEGKNKTQNYERRK